MSDYIADYIRGNMDIKVSIYERVKQGKKWHEKHVPMPRTIKNSEGGYVLYARDERNGTFLISWYEKRRKKRQKVEGRRLSDAVTAARSKQWYLNSRRHGLKAEDPTVENPRPEIYASTELYLAGKSGCAKTLSAHRLALKQFREFCATEGIAYTDEITTVHTRRFYEKLVGNGNVPFTAANKILKVNSFYRAVMHRDPGHGIITKKDYKRELTASRVPERYTKQELDALFAHMDDYEHLLFSTLLDSGLRKKELMYLEDSDLLNDEMAPGMFKCELRVQSKPQWGFQTKTGQARNVLISKETMDRLQERKDTARPSKLLFGARTGKPDWHMLDKLKAVAEKAGIDPDTVDLHKFRATAATTWLRSRELGGKGWDIGFVRQQLGHQDLQSIEHYIALVRSDELAMREQQADGAPRLGGPGGLIYSVE